MMKDDFNEARVTAAAEHVRKKLTAFIEAVPSDILKDCPAWKDNGLTLGEKELAIIRALGLMVMDSTQRMFRFQTEVEEHDA